MNLYDWLGLVALIAAVASLGDPEFWALLIISNLLRIESRIHDLNKRLQE